MAKKEKPFATEVDLCKAFLSVLPKEWTAYAETAGWDILVVRKADGFQIGLQAKLQCNVDVINQTIEEYGAWRADRAGPDCRAILVPHDEQYRFSRIAAYIGVTIIGVRRGTIRPSDYDLFPNLPGNHNDALWHEWGPLTRHKLPEYVPDVDAGAPCPVQLTDWKIRALKLEAVLEIRGYVTRADFKWLHLDHRRWLAAEGYLAKDDGDRFVRCDRSPMFSGAHPVVYEQIKAERDQWAPLDLRSTPAEAA